MISIPVIPVGILFLLEQWGRWLKIQRNRQCVFDRFCSRGPTEMDDETREVDIAKVIACPIKINSEDNLRTEYSSRYSQKDFKSQEISSIQVINLAQLNQGQPSQTIRDV